MPKNLTNKRFGRLVVIKPVGKTKNHCVLWLCKCDCGNFTTAVTGKLNYGHVKSCGCLKGGLKHGLTKHPLFQVWSDMKRRCLKPDHKSYPRYGGRGIKVCASWRKDSEAFIKYCLKHGWAPGLLFDRIDNNGHYEPGNIRFVDPSVSSANKEAFGNTPYAGIFKRIDCASYMGTVKFKGKQLFSECRKNLFELLVERDLFILVQGLPNKLNLLKRPEGGATFA